MTTCNVCYTSIDYSGFRDSVPLTERAWNCLTSDKSLSLHDWKRRLGFQRRWYDWLFLMIAGLLIFP